MLELIQKYNFLNPFHEDNHFLWNHKDLFVCEFKRDLLYELCNEKMIIYQFFHTHLYQTSKKSKR